MRRFDVTGQKGQGNGKFSGPRGVCVAPGPEGRVYVADFDNHRVQVLTKDGAYVRTIGVTGEHGEGRGDGRAGGEEQSAEHGDSS